MGWHDELSLSIEDMKPFTRNTSYSWAVFLLTMWLYMFFNWVTLVEFRDNEMGDNLAGALSVPLFFIVSAVVGLVVAHEPTDRTVMLAVIVSAADVAFVWFWLYPFAVHLSEVGINADMGWYFFANTFCLAVVPLIFPLYFWQSEHDKPYKAVVAYGAAWIVTQALPVIGVVKHAFF